MPYYGDTPGQAAALQLQDEASQRQYLLGLMAAQNQAAAAQAQARAMQDNQALQWRALQANLAQNQEAQAYNRERAGVADRQFQQQLAAATQQRDQASQEANNHALYNQLLQGIKTGDINTLDQFGNIEGGRLGSDAYNTLVGELQNTNTKFQKMSQEASSLASSLNERLKRANQAVAQTQKDLLDNPTDKGKQLIASTAEDNRQKLVALLDKTLQSARKGHLIEFKDNAYVPSAAVVNVPAWDTRKPLAAPQAAAPAPALNDLVASMKEAAPELSGTKIPVANSLELDAAFYEPYVRDLARAQATPAPAQSIALVNAAYKKLGALSVNKDVATAPVSVAKNANDEGGLFFKARFPQTAKAPAGPEVPPPGGDALVSVGNGLLLAKKHVPAFKSDLLEANSLATPEDQTAAIAKVMAKWKSKLQSIPRPPAVDVLGAAMAQARVPNAW